MLLDLADAFSPSEHFSKIDLAGIEPFTVIVWERGSLWECGWDGFKKEKRSLDSLKAQIWSSVTLYDEATIAMRRQWFGDWIDQTPSPSHKQILAFHEFSGNGNKDTDLVMHRDNGYRTVSITSARIGADSGVLDYLDTVQQQHARTQISFTKAIVSS